MERSPKARRWVGIVLGLAASAGSISAARGQPAGVQWRVSADIASCTGPNGWTGDAFDDSLWQTIVLPDTRTTVTSRVSRFYRARVNLVAPSLSLSLTSDDGAEIYVNGLSVGSFGNGCPNDGCVNRPGTCPINVNVPAIDVDPAALVVGENVVAVHLWNGPLGAYFDLAMVTPSVTPTPTNTPRSCETVEDCDAGEQCVGSFCATPTPPPTAMPSITLTPTVTATRTPTGTPTNTATATFLPGPWTTTGALLSSRGTHTATLLANGKVLVAGGATQATPYSATAELFDPTTGKWFPTGSLNVGRAAHAATLLPNGKVLVASGRGTAGQITSAELYDPATGVWSLTGSLAEARQAHTATLLANGTVLVAGGLNDNAGTRRLASAELYDPGTGAWETVGTLGTPRSSHTATLLPNGSVLVVAGTSGAALDSAEIYNPSSKTWSLTASLAVPRASHVATLLDNGTVLVAGGSTTSAELYDPVTATWSTTGSSNVARLGPTATLLPTGEVLLTSGSSAEVYDPVGATWRLTGNLAIVHANQTATLLPSGLVLLVGGASGIAELYDPTAGAWSAAGTALTRRRGHTTTLLRNGTLLAAGGYNGAYLAGADLYDPVGGVWSPTGSLNAARSNHTATVLPDGTVLVVGGTNGSALASAEIYDPDTGMWSATGPLATARANHTAVWLGNGRVLVAGGYNGSILRSAELYDLATRVWTSTGLMATPRADHTTTLLFDGTVLAAGGTSTLLGAGLAGCERYDPVTGTWSDTGALTTARTFHTATLLPSGAVLAAGGSDFVLLDSTERYDPGTGTWAPTATLASVRREHTATLLRNGQVLVVGGHNLGNRHAELYDPAAARWRLTGNLATVRSDHTATLLPDGSVVVVGGFNTANGDLASAERYAVQVDPASQPLLTAVTSPVQLGGPLSAGGSRFRGRSEASGGNGMHHSPSNYPLLQLRSLDNEQSGFLPSHPASVWSDTAVTSQPVTGFPPGFALVTVFTNGVPSVSRIVAVEGPLVVNTPTPNPFTATATPTLTRTRTPTPTRTSISCPPGDRALSLNGAGQLVRVANFPGFPSGMQAPLTIEMWLRADANGVIVSKHGGAGNQTFFVERENQRFIINFANFTSVAVTANDTTPPGQWLHVALVYNGGGATNGDRLQVYVNGTAMPFSVLNGPIPDTLVESNAPFEIGGASARASFLDGTVDEVRVYAAALDAATILDHYAGGIGACGAGGEPGLLAGYHFDDTCGATAADYSGNGYHAALVNGPQWVEGFVGCLLPRPTLTPTFSHTPTRTPTDTPTRTPTVPPTATSSPSPTRTATLTPAASATSSVTATPSGTATPSVTATASVSPTPTITNSPTVTATASPTATPCTSTRSALSFSGAAQRVAVHDFADFPSGLHAQVTIEMWVRVDTTARTVFLAKHGGVGDQTLFVEREEQRYNINFANFTSVAVTGNDGVPSGQWLHFALVYDGGGAANADRLRVYTNGVALPFTVFNNPIPTTLAPSAAPFEIAGTPARSSFLTGMVDEVRVYAAALSPATIAAHYHGGSGTCGASGESALLAGYHFDEACGATVADYSGNGHHGAAINGPIWVTGVVDCGPPTPTPLPTRTPRPCTQHNDCVSGESCVGLFCATHTPVPTITPTPTVTRTPTTTRTPTITSTPAPWQWRVSPDQPNCTAPAGWASPSFDDSGWQAVTLPDTRNTQSNNMSRYYRRSIPLASRDLRLFLWSDDGAEVFVNGTSIGQFARRCPGEGCVNRQEFCGINFNVFDLVVAPELLAVGDNLIAVHLWNAPGGAYLDVALLTPTATPLPTATPQPCTGDGGCGSGETCLNERCATPTPLPTPPGGCALLPSSGCFGSSRSTLTVHAAAPKLRWGWKGGNAVDFWKIGNPIHGATGYRACLYDMRDGAPVLTFGAAVPGGIVCGRRPCWKVTGKRLTFSSPGTAADGIKRLSLQPSTRTGAALSLIGGGRSLPLAVPAEGPLFQQQPSVIAQLQRSDSTECWQAVFPNPASRSTQSVFVDTTR